MSFVVIVKSGKDSPRWRGMPHAHPVHCEEFDTLEGAMAAHPGKIVMTVSDYKAHAEFYHTNHPAPEIKKPWWKFWRRKHV